MAAGLGEAAVSDRLLAALYVGMILTGLVLIAMGWL
jgi:hypothetical protein